MNCPACEFPFYSANKKCPKCDFVYKSFRNDKSLTVDICHQGENRREARIKLISAIEKAQRGKNRRIRIIHGYGSSGSGGVIKDFILQYIKEHYPSFKIKKDGDNLGAHILILK